MRRGGAGGTLRSMYVDVWQAPLGEISEAAASEFFDRPLEQNHAFLFETARLALGRHRGALSLKFVLSGEERYWIGGQAVAVQPGNLLLVNAGQAYRSEISTPTRSLSLFYRAEDATEIGCFHQRDSDALVDPQEHLPGALEVPQVRIGYSAATREALAGLLAAIDQRDSSAAEQAALSLLASALWDAGKVVPESALAHVRRRSTRTELISRAGRAREFIEDRQGVACPLDRLAEVACLSKYHLLRVFRAAFGQTPAAYARALRLAAARRALARGDPPERVARRTGYANSEVLRRALRSAH